MNREQTIFKRVRRTSKETYNQIRAEGLLSKMRFYVYDIIFRYQPLNISQIIEIARRDGSQLINTGSITGRISELVDREVIEEGYISPCPITGRNTVFWVTTDNLPKQLEKPKTRKVDLDEFYNKMRYDLAEDIPYATWLTLERYVREYES